MKHFRLSVSLLVVLVFTLVFIGCAKPPEAEKQAAKAAMDAAISAGADKYATDSLDAAKKIWDTAESQMKEKKYEEAKKSYIDAATAFKKAAMDAGKKAAADQANAALATVEGSWKNVEAMAKKVGKKLKDKEAWTADAKAIKEGLGKAKEMITANPFQAKTKLDDLKTMVDKWENTFKEMVAAAPAKPEAAKKGKK
jgi:ATP-dependent exoDNAse (exonuclease V) beta subunit